MSSRPNPTQALVETYGPSPYLHASDRIFEHFSALGKKIERTGDPNVQPDTLLPVDVFLGGLGKHKNSPQVVLRPQRRGDYLWTESVRMYVYEGIEDAFVKAHLAPGGNRTAHKKQLLELETWVEAQLGGEISPVPKYFVQTTTLLFAEGVLRDRRDERIGVLMDIADHAPPRRTDLEILLRWLEEDLQNDVFRGRGRSAAEQPIVFAKRIARLWKSLTGHEVPKAYSSSFTKFANACWESGFPGEKLVPNLGRIVRYDIDR